MSEASDHADPRPVAVVTGASSGLGETIARRLAERGHRVLLVARRADRLATLAAELPGALAVEADLLADDGPARVAAAVDAVGGRLAVLVNNAGIGGRGTFADAGYEGVRRTMALNFDAQLRLTEALLPALRAAAPSSILIVSSVSGASRALVQAPTPPPSSRSSAGPMPSAQRRRRTGCTSARWCPGSSPRRASRSANSSPSAPPHGSWVAPRWSPTPSSNSCAPVGRSATPARVATDDPAGRRRPAAHRAARRGRFPDPEHRHRLIARA